MRISDWSSDVCSSDLAELYHRARQQGRDPWWQRWGCRMTGSDIIGALLREHQPLINVVPLANIKAGMLPEGQPLPALLVRTVSLVDRQPLKRGGWCRSEEHTSELQSLMRISYAVFCLKKKKHK